MKLSNMGQDLQNQRIHVMNELIQELLKAMETRPKDFEYHERSSKAMITSYFLFDREKSMPWQFMPGTKTISFQGEIFLSYNSNDKNETLDKIWNIFQSKKEAAENAEKNARIKRENDIANSILEKLRK